MATRRKRIGNGIYRDRYGLSAIVKVGPRSACRQREKRFSFDTPLREIKAWQRDMRADLGRSLGRRLHQRGERSQATPEPIWRK